MIQESADRMQVELDELIEKYETVRAFHGEVDLLACLPATDHPLYKEARREIVRIDLEYSWQHRCPKRLPVYMALFPDLLDDPESAQQITYEEYRQRVLAGESPSASEYAQQYGVDTTSWPGNDADIEAYPKTIVAPAAPPTPPLFDENRDTAVNGVPTPPFEWNILDDAYFPKVGQRPVSLSSATAQALLKQKVSQSAAEVSFLLAQALTTLPEVGTRFLNFHLIAELGRGSFGRVYLARQEGLANRLVALKITVDLQGEEQKLAQLQHTNVVPIYSTHSTGDLQAVCMPYFGPTTLADVVSRCHDGKALPTNGSSLVETIRMREAEFHQKIQAPSAEIERETLPAPVAGTVARPTLKLLENSTYTDAVLALMERITEGLLHAHEHGILHGDLKPANILLTDEGQPMLLDFNLATDLKVRAAIGELRVGGTLPYMAPEHLAALLGGDRQCVDARSDLYSLGVILFELLTGEPPFETRRGPLSETLPGMIEQRRQDPPRLRPRNPSIPYAVESIVRRCLDPEPAARYQNAQELHEDLQRQRQNLPLAHAPEPSVKERAQKWVRRHPHATAPANILFVVLVLIGLALTPGAWRSYQSWQQDRQKLAEAATEVDLAKRKREDAEEKMQFAAVQAREAETRVRSMKLFREFHAAAGVANDVIDCVALTRMRPDTWPIEKQRLGKYAADCRKILGTYRVLDDAEWQSQPEVNMLPDAERESLRRDVVSLLYAQAEADFARAERLRGAGEHQSFGFSVEVAGQNLLATAQLCNVRALECFAPDAVPGSILMQRASLERHRGNRAEADRLQKLAEDRTPSDALADAYWTAAALTALANEPIEDAYHYAGLIEARKRQWRKIEQLLKAAIQQFPDHFGAWQLRALCHQSAGEFRQAEGYWDTCAALRPNDPWVRCFRGEVALHQGRWPDAEKDFSAFLKKHPDFSDAYVHRAEAWEKQKVYVAAIEDLTEAIRHGAPMEAELYYARASLKATNGNDVDAIRDHKLRLVATPTEVDDLIYSAMFRTAEKNWHLALKDLERALAIDPRNVRALYQKAIILADHLHKREEALVPLRHLLIVNPEHVEARLMRGLIYAKDGKRSAAIRDAELALHRNVTPARSYQAACIFAFTLLEVADDSKRAIELLTSALKNGYGIDQFQDDPNFRHLKEREEFKTLKSVAKYLATSR